VLGDLDHRLRPPGGWLIGAAVLLLLVCVLAACQGASRPLSAVSRSLTLTASYPGVTASALARGRWSRLPSAPIPDRDYPVGVWTGRELLVWGGQSGPHESARPRRRRCLRPRPPPLAGAASGAPDTPHPGGGRMDRSGADRLGRLRPLGHRPWRRARGRDGAAYDPTRQAWRRLPPAPLSARADATAVWTGQELLVLGGSPAPRSDRDRPYTDGAAYNPERHSWRRLAPSPQLRGPMVNQHLVWTGTRLLVWTDWEQLQRSTVTMPGGQHAIREEGRDGVDVWGYDPTGDRWAVLPAAPGQPALGGAVMVWTGREVLSVTGRPYHGPALARNPGGRYDPARNRWRRLADGQLDTAAVPTGLWTARRCCCGTVPPSGVALPRPTTGPVTARPRTRPLTGGCACRGRRWADTAACSVDRPGSAAVGRQTMADAGCPHRHGVHIGRVVTVDRKDDNSERGIDAEVERCVTRSSDLSGSC
jgi:hypothetical protein